MTLEQLKVLQKIVELGSLKAAAQALHKTQPALSIAIKKLEQQYSIQLLDRQQYRLTLTSHGKIFYRQAQVLLLGADQLDSLGHQLAEGNEALFRIGYDPLCNLDMLLAILKQCQQQFPTTEFQIISGSRFSSLEQLNDDDVDVAIGAWFHLFHGLGDYQALPVGEFKLVLAAAPSLFDKEVVTSLQQLNQYPCVTLLESSLSFDNERLGIHSAKQQFKTKDVHTLKSLIRQGLGCAIIPRSHIEAELASGELITLALEDFEESLDGEVRMIKKIDKVFGPVGQFFWQAVSENSSKLVAASN
ncbi:LysR family transcriptional regulator [Psychrobium sp. 1_MG-2023]|uniref:LysR family transcriptional regulator n=1 Tax=Psychrobium sp. 1_MG-2023 TaxID=3062624 RepID=UPI000C349CCD|nr:LysR family transcriptional regulator [Psychrobium sp. 1_MG-2023]MDP2562253.1 LysR family transcriptional regulator [Psychrobium sp. 1_MG-2023]PKF57503.1 LysR family transcriptional regulator [Alteromonadales bacterium alter-6D02]